MNIQVKIIELAYFCWIFLTTAEKVVKNRAKTRKLIRRIPCEKFRNNSADFLSFSAFADWGGSNQAPYVNPWAIQIARSINRYSHKCDSKFLMLVGDNFYSQGVENVEDSRFTG